MKKVKILLMSIVCICGCASAHRYEKKNVPNSKDAAFLSDSKSHEEIKFGKHGKSITIVNDAKLSEASTVLPPDAAVIGSVGGRVIYKDKAVDIGKPNSHYLGVAYQDDTKDVGMLTKEITVKFVNSESYLNYAAKYDIKEVVPKSGVYVIFADSLSQWKEIMARLQADSSISYVSPRVVVGEKKPQ